MELDHKIYPFQEAPKVKENLPTALRSPLGLGRVIFRRLITWGKVIRRTSGVSSKDKKILARAVFRAPLTVFHDLKQWQYPMVDEDCLVVSKNIGIFKIRAKTDDLKHILRGQEPAVEATIRKMLKPNDTFVDAGANIGFYTLLASQLVGDQGRVFSFEMIPETSEILRSHVKQNACRNVKVIEGALAETEGLSIFASIVEGKSGQSSVYSRKGTSKVDVGTITLADKLKDVPLIKLMKMDIEGAEKSALQGMGDDLRKVQAIIFESRGTEDVVEYIQARGFKVRRLDGNNALALQETRRLNEKTSEVS